MDLPLSGGGLSSVQHYLSPLSFFVSVIRWPLRMPISTSDATAATNALAGAITDPSARVAANPGARASVISP